MTTPLHDLLDDLAGSVDPASPALAARAWADGRRRRMRSRVQAVVAIAAALVLLTGLVHAVRGPWRTRRARRRDRDRAASRVDWYS